MNVDATGAPDTAAAVNLPTEGGAATPPTDWTSGLSEDHRGFVQIKGFKDPGVVIDSYRNLEKHLGVPKERLLKLPEADDSPEWSDIYNKLGRPGDPKEYKFDIPKEHGSEEFADWARSTFHELGLSKRQAEALAGKWNEKIHGTLTEQQEGYEAQIKGEESSLKKEWGMAYQQNINVASRTAKTFGLGPEVIDKLEQAMGFAGVMKFMHQIGSGLGEDSFVGGGSNSGGFGQGGALTPEAAKYKIKELKSDPSFVKKYTSGDYNAKQEMDKLHAFAYPTLDEKN